MLSVIVYGRNDNHGYNMHKRIAISLNCIAEVLTDPDDEILYVDYNTSNDLPTVIEAIQDTLTEKAKKITRVFRVRPEIHDRLKDRTHAQVNEPLARNIALRRSNPKNKWILSTNTDLVFTILEQGKSLSDIVNKTEDGFYELARFDVPEPLWESLDRKNPTEVISKFREWGRTLHLNEVVYGNKTIIYDAPGDFQLMLREDAFKINGFDEAMIWGWHVDSNLCKRMMILRGEVKSLQDKLYGYHCNHTRTSGWMHSVKRKENSIETFFENVTEATLVNQKNWGLADEKVEEIKIGFDPTTTFCDKISKMITPMKEEFTESFYNSEGYDKITYSTDHVVPYLFEQLVNLKAGSNILYVGQNQLMFNKIEEFVANSNNISDLYYHQLFLQKEARSSRHHIFELKPKIAKKITAEEISTKVDLIIFDFGIDKSQIVDFACGEFVRKILFYQEFFAVKIACQKTDKTIKVININVHNSRYYKNIKKFFDPIQNPYSSGVMMGRIVDSEKLLRQHYQNLSIKKLENIIKNYPKPLFFLLFPFISVAIVLHFDIFCFFKLLSLRKRKKRSFKIINKFNNIHS